jgi:ribosomal protein S18 acetylase RimI-like enzyme
MKRLFVRSDFRGLGLGRELLDAILRCAAAIGYRRIRLDTLPSHMAAAVEMYRKVGFAEIPSYTRKPLEGAKYMELEIQKWQAIRQSVSECLAGPTP